MDKLSCAERRAVASDECLAEVYAATRVHTISALSSTNACRDSDGQPSVASRRRRRQRMLLLNDCVPRSPIFSGPDFLCDSGLGGLARWLRAAGYEAEWWLHIDDDDLLRRAGDTSAILLTNDSRLASRAVLQRGYLPNLLVPIAMRKREQFRFVVRQLQLPMRRPKCMACSGQLRPVQKEQVRHRIPARTYPWCDRYWLCTNCDKLYWEGTHWREIERELTTAAANRAKSIEQA